MISGYLIWFYIGGAQQAFTKAWKFRLKYPVVEAALIDAALIMTAGFALAIFMGFLGWQKHPRFSQSMGMARNHAGLLCFQLCFR